MEKAREFFSAIGNLGMGYFFDPVYEDRLTDEL